VILVQVLTQRPPILTSFLWFSLVPQGKFWDDVLKYAMIVCFHIQFQYSESSCCLLLFNPGFSKSQLPAYQGT